MKFNLNHILTGSAALAVLILCTPIAYSQRTEVSVEEASSLCTAMRNQYIRDYAGWEPEFQTSTQIPPDNKLFEFHNWVGVSIPIVSEHDGWRFVFHFNYTILVNENHRIEYMIRNAVHAGDGEVFVRMQEHRNLPPPSIEGVDLMKAALSIDPARVNCNSDSAVELLDRFWTIGTKAVTSRDAEVVFAHQGSLLTRRPFDRSSERWLFLARDSQTGKYKDIAITVYEPRLFPQIGLRIGGDGGSGERVTPSWLDQFFLTAAHPSRASFEALVKAVGDYPLPASVMELVDDTLYSELPN